MHGACPYRPGGHYEQSNTFNSVCNRAQQSSDILRDLKKFTSTNIIKSISENDKESRKSCLPELQVGMLWIFKDAGDKNNRNKLPSLPERVRG